MPKMKARAVQNDKGEDTGKPKYSVGNPSMAEIKNEQQNPSVKRIVLYLKIWKIVNGDCFFAAIILWLYL